jgi:hypothetical protein
MSSRHFHQILGLRTRCAQPRYFPGAHWFRLALHMPMGRKGDIRSLIFIVGAKQGVLSPSPP